MNRLSQYRYAYRSFEDDPVFSSFGVLKQRNGNSESAESNERAREASGREDEHEGAGRCPLRRVVSVCVGVRDDALPACSPGVVVAALGADKSEVLCVFLRSKLRTEEIAKLASDKATGSFVQHAVEDAASSAVIPHTTRTYSLLHALNDASAVKKEIAVEDLETFLSKSENQPLLSDQKTDLLVVRIADKYSLPETDELIKAATQLLSLATDGSVDFALTGDEAEPKKISSPLGRRLMTSAGTTTAAVVCETGFQIGYSSVGKAFCFSHYVHMTPEVLTGVLFGLFFLFLAYVGLSALSAIQTPTRYPHHGPPRGKEF